jgi:hypothetical protein
MEFAPDTVRAFRYWIQGYPGFYEPIVGEYFRAMDYQVIRRPAQVGKADIELIRSALFDGRRRLGHQVDGKAIIQHLASRSRLQPDLLLEKDDRCYLAELKSWGGFSSGVFDLATLRSEFFNKPDASSFFLVDSVDGRPIAGKILVVSSRSRDHEQVLNQANQAYQTPVEIVYLDELVCTPQLAGFIERQLRYLDAAVAELRQAFGPPTGNDT